MGENDGEKRVVIADDITGAGDSGIHFAAAGQRIALLLRREALEPALRDHEMAILSSESRFLAPDAAAEAARRAVRDCRAAGAAVVYKKIDSTLRGNPGAEIGAILDEAGFRTALVCPAMPKTGRAVRGGRLFLRGRPLVDTESGRDPFNPVPSADIAETLSEQTRLALATVSLAHVRAGAEALAKIIAGLIAQGARILVADAESDFDLAAIAAAIRIVRREGGEKTLLPVGAGGFAEAMAGCRKPYAGPVPAGRMLAVVGSLTQTSLDQIDHAARHGGFRLLEMDVGAWNADREAELRRLSESAAAGGAPLLLKNRAAPTGRIDVAEGIRAAGMFAEAACAVARAGQCAILYATGGSTAMAVLQKLGVSAITLEREYMPGVVMSSFAPPGTGLRWFVSKAGGFGGPETIVRLAEAMRAE